MSHKTGTLRGALIATLLAGAFVALGAAFFYPIVSTDFRVDLTAADYSAIWLSTTQPAESSSPSGIGEKIRQGFINWGTKKIAARIGQMDDSEVAHYNTKLKEIAITKGGIVVGDYYLGGMIQMLFRSQEYGIGIAILLFSVIFPLLKIILASVCLVPAFNYVRRQRLIGAVAAASKWSMADVFIVALMIVMFKAKGFHYEFQAGAGIYAYGLAFLLSSVAVHLLQQTLTADAKQQAFS